jgi:hypothetical protein
MDVVQYTMTLTTSPDLRRQIADAVGRLVSTRQFGETAVVSLPVMYPSGTFAGVHITVSGDKCFVSDSAIGLREAEMAGAADFFDPAARDAAQWYGVNFDGASVFAASASLARIEGAVAAVANASCTAVARALLRAAEAKEQTRNTAVYDVVSEIFGRQNVAKMADVTGKKATWPAHNVVTLRGRRAIFEYVSPHTNSIANKFLMFSDLMQADDPPSCNSVVKSLAAFGQKGSLLHDVSNVVELGAERDMYRRLADAA